MPVYEMVAHQTQYGNELTNNFYVYGEDLDASDYAGLGNKVRQAYDALNTYLHTSWELVQVAIRPLDGTGFPFVNTGAIPLAGQNVTEPMPPSSVIRVGWKCVSAPPNLRWVMLSGWVENSNLNGVIEGTTLSACATFAQAVSGPDSVNLKTFSWVATRIEGSPQIAAAWNELDAIFLSSDWRYLKSRRLIG